MWSLHLPFVRDPCMLLTFYDSCSTRKKQTPSLCAVYRTIFQTSSPCDPDLVPNAILTD